MPPNTAPLANRNDAIKAEMTKPSLTPSDAFEPVGDVPIEMVNTYARLWQLETWLRTMVYVELRALSGDDWAGDLNTNSGSFQADKSLTHMPTSEMNALSYAQLSKLITLIDTNWDCFAGYFPPKSLWSSKLEEISQIRHRAAHFRVGHADDLLRVKQFLRDIDKGFWRFCTSYNDASPILPQSSDPITSRFLALDPLPWVEIEPRKWAQIGRRDKSLAVGLSIRLQRRPWATGLFQPGSPGYLYDFYLFAQDGRDFDMSYLLNRTQHLHSQFVHLCLESDKASIRVTAPAVLGDSVLIDLIQNFYDTALNAVRRGGRGLDKEAMDALAHTWPEYVIGPSNPLSFLGPDMPCSFFGM